jgi:hypothetical protein
MITKPTYFTGVRYLPHAKASITDAVTDVEIKLVDFINRYERDCLEKCLGGLSIEFFSNLDSAEPTFIKSGSDAKWEQLMNGHSYTNSSGDDCIWKGIRRSVLSLGDVPPDPIVPNDSFLADYVYFYHEASAYIVRANAGNVKNKVPNGESVMPNEKVINAWRRFVYAVQGDCQVKKYIHKSGFLGGYGVDYSQYTRNEDVTLYQYINDMNSLVEGTFEKFNPKTWGNINQFTI